MWRIWKFCSKKKSRKVLSWDPTKVRSHDSNHVLEGSNGGMSFKKKAESALTEHLQHDKNRINTSTSSCTGSSKWASALLDDTQACCSLLSSPPFLPWSCSRFLPVNGSFFRFRCLVALWLPVKSLEAISIVTKSIVQLNWIEEWAPFMSSQFALMPQWCLNSRAKEGRQ